MATAKNNNALKKALTPSAELAAVVGVGQLSRGETVSKIWDYIKKNNLQNPANKREILADAKLKPIFRAGWRFLRWHKYRRSGASTNEAVRDW